MQGGFVTTIDPPAVPIGATDAEDQPERAPALEALYRGFESELLIPLWTQPRRSSPP